MNRIALISCTALPEPDHDAVPLLVAMHEAGIRTDVLAWDDPAVTLQDVDLAVFRSCWNYHLAPDRFLEWIDRADGVTRLANPAPVVRWNLHKEYLRELRDAGVPIVPTVWFRRGERLDLAEVLRERGWNEIVIKPSISASSYRTERFTRDEVVPGQQFLDALSADADGMIQRFMPGIASGGERALVQIDGTLTHSVIKEPRFAGGGETVALAPGISDAEKTIADLSLRTVPEDLLYARVDVILDETTGQPLLSELELIEPSLFLLQNPSAIPLLVNGMRRRARAS